MESNTVFNRQILFIDMDETLVDFNRDPAHDKWGLNRKDPSAMYAQGFFENLKPIEGAVEAVNALMNSQLFDIYILTKPLVANVFSYSEKASWVMKYLPRLINKVIMTQDKSMIKGDILIDDDLQWQGWGGEFIHFKRNDMDWHSLCSYLIIKYYQGGTYVNVKRKGASKK